MNAGMNVETGSDSIPEYQFSFYENEKIPNRGI
jgi:hypothetical protein